MKRGLKKKVIVCGFAAMLVFLGVASLIAKTREGNSDNGEPVSVENKTAKPVLEERLRIAAPMEDFSLERNSADNHIDLDDVYDYDGPYGILTEVEELDPRDLITAVIDTTNTLVVESHGKTGRAGIVVRFYENGVSVAPASWGDVKNMFKNGRRKSLSKPCLESVSDTVYVNVISDNKKPAISEIPNIIFTENASHIFDLDDYVTDPNNTDAELTWAGDSKDLSVTIYPKTHLTVIKAPKDWHGTSYVNFMVTDPEGLFDFQKVDAKVISNNKKPVISNIPGVTIKEDGSFSLPLDDYVTDPDNKKSELVWSAETENFDVQIDLETRVANVRPTTDWNGEDYVNFTAQDPEGLSDSGKVNVTVEAMSDLRCAVWNLLWENSNLERAVKDAVVEVNGVSDTTDENGKVNFQFEPGFYKIKITHPDFYDWTTSVKDFTHDRVEEEELILKKDIEACEIYWDNDAYKSASRIVNMKVGDLFRMWWQDTTTMKIQGWGREGELAGKGPDNVYIDTNPAWSSGKEITREQIDLNYEIINYAVGHGLMDMPNIEQGTNPPEMGAYDWVNIWWRDDGGPGYHFEDLNGSQIYSGGVMFWTKEPCVTYTKDDRRETYLQEITQCFAGATTEAETAYFWDENGYYLPVVKDLALILRHRFIGGTMCEGP